MQAVFVIWACLATGEDCRPRVISEPMPLFQCLAGPTGQAEVLKWLRQHPKHRYVKHSCVDPKRLAALLGRGQA